jgi:hypothetical protein
MVKAATTHLWNAARGLTYCGKSRQQETVRGVKYWRVRALAIIGPNELADSATCKACQRVDDAMQVRNYRRECREAGIDPDTMQPLSKVKP